MKMVHALGLSIAILVAFWVYLSIGLPQLKLYPWIGFVAWAAFFAAGGGKAGIVKPMAASSAGVLLTALTMYAVGQVGGSLIALMVLVAILAFVLVAISEIDLFTYTPAAFLGAATYFGTGSKVDISIAFVLLSWLAGLLLGFVSEVLGVKMGKQVPEAAES